MASVDWKCKSHDKKSSRELIKHNDKEQRLKDKHSNKHIDKNLTPYNIDYLNLSFEDKRKKFNDRVKSLEPNSRITKQTTYYIGLEIPIPENVSDIHKFGEKAFDIVKDMVGEKNIVCADLHVDEKHKYIDPITREKRESLNHLHFGFVPGYEENGVERLCGKKFATKANIIKLNKQIQEMCLNEFGVSFLTGKGQKSTDSVESLKLQSAQAEFLETISKYTNKTYNLDEIAVAMEDFKIYTDELEKSKLEVNTTLNNTFELIDTLTGKDYDKTDTANRIDDLREWVSGRLNEHKECESLCNLLKRKVESFDRVLDQQQMPLDKKHRYKSNNQTIVKATDDIQRKQSNIIAETVRLGNSFDDFIKKQMEDEEENLP